jgi:sensor histidine kinase regulating citrate/malate metabolism
MEAALVGLMGRSTASGWLLCIIGVVGVLTLLKILAAQRPKMKELEIGEDASIRAFMAAQMNELRDEIKGLRVETKDLRDENHELRREVKSLHGVIDGMRRDALQAGISTQRAVVESLPPGFVPAATKEALDRIKGTTQ